MQAHRRELGREQDEESPQRRRVLEDRRKLSELLKLARAAPEKMPKVVSIRSFEREKKFLLRFGWGVAGVKRYRFSIMEPVQYSCDSPCTKAEDPEVAEDLACAAALLAEFPTLAWYAGSRVQ